MTGLVESEGTGVQYLHCSHSQNRHQPSYLAGAWPTWHEVSRPMIALIVGQGFSRIRRSFPSGLVTEPTDRQEVKTELYRNIRPDFNFYSQTSHKQPPKTSSLGRLRAPRPYWVKMFPH